MKGIVVWVAVVLCSFVSRCNGDLGDGLLFGDDPRKPKKLNNEILCDVCHGIVQQFEKKMGKKQRSEHNVLHVLENVCEQSNFMSYKSIPPTMVKGCETVMDKFGEQFEHELWKSPLRGRVLEEHICSKVTSLCKGVKYFTMQQEQEEAARLEEEEFQREKRALAAASAGKDKKSKTSDIEPVHAEL